ncbi:MAG: hypothetical protein H6659_11120 [Ardenticatenaceae bacterium]|nr:hypothetical protein [Ardenticatenaceae bacterium]MCB8987582.1 hypothetical protein [Ardenticatenaceae bacterium]
MKKVKLLLTLLLIGLLAVFAACSADDNSPNNPDNPNTMDQTTTTALPPTESVPAADTASPADVGASGEGGDMNAWLQQVNNDQTATMSQGEALDWGLGYLVYYGDISEVGLDNLIYNALEVQKRLDTGAVTADNMSLQAQNLLDLTDGIEYDPSVELTQQVAQTPDVRQTILNRISQDQSGLSPQEALDANEVSGIVALNSADTVGRKYLVYTQDSPDDDFSFLGTVIAADAAPQTGGEPYSYQNWQELPLLGDATGPFWNDLPTGVSDDPANTDEGRPGVLLVSQTAFEDINQGNMGQ